MHDGSDPGAACSRAAWGRSWRSCVNCMSNPGSWRWTRIVSLMSVFVSMSSLMIAMPFFATHAANAFHVSETEVGFVIACSPVAQVITTPIWGMGAQRFGRANCLLCSLILICSGSTFLSMAKSMRSCAIGRFMQGCGTQGCMTAGVAMYLDNSQNLSKDMGYVELLVGIAYMVAPAIGGAAYQNFGFALAVVPAVVFAGLTAILTVLTVKMDCGSSAGAGSYELVGVHTIGDPDSPSMIAMAPGVENEIMTMEEEALRLKDGEDVFYTKRLQRETSSKSVGDDVEYGKKKLSERAISIGDDVDRGKASPDKVVGGGGEGGERGTNLCVAVFTNRTAIWVAIAIASHSGGQVFSDMVLGKHLFLSQGADAALAGALFAVAPAICSVACIIIGANKTISNKTLISMGLILYALGFYFLAPPPGFTSESDFITPHSRLPPPPPPETSPHIVDELLSESIGLNSTQLFDSIPAFLPAWRLSRQEIWFLDIAGLLCMGVGSALILVPAIPCMMQGFQSPTSVDSFDPTDMVTSIYSGAWSLGELIGPPVGGMLLERLPRERDINCSVSASECFWAFHWTMLLFAVLLSCSATGFFFCVPTSTSTPEKPPAEKDPNERD